jgi:hypothetical protein
MYGIVNKAIHGLIIENHGRETWEKIKAHAGIDTDFFLSNEAYPDEITYKLAASSAAVLNISVEDVLTSFGEYWVLNTGKKSYGDLMMAGGNSLKEFLINLPGFHSRVMLIYPNLTPPEFKVNVLSENSVQLHYFSQRTGLTHFVYGLVSGLGKLYRVSVTIEIIEQKEKGHSHDVFLVEWQ